MQCLYFVDNQLLMRHEVAGDAIPREGDRVHLRDVTNTIIPASGWYVGAVHHNFTVTPADAGALYGVMQQEVHILLLRPGELRPS